MAKWPRKPASPVVLLPTVKVADFEGPGSSPYGGAQMLFTIEGSHYTVSAVS